MNSVLARVFIVPLLPGFLAGCALRTGKQARHEVPPLYSANAPEFRQAAGSLLGPNFVGGNNVVTLVNGRQIDDAFVPVGSGNFDNRSIRLNDETNLNVLDRQFAAQQTKLFEMDKRKSREVGLDPLGKLHPINQVAGLASPQL